MGKLSTHVLDVVHGKPGVGVSIALYRVVNDGKTLLKNEKTNADGRCDAPLLQGEELQIGQYELHFSAGDYFEAQGINVPTPRFVDRVYSFPSEYVPA
ncbi:MAG: hydroxyisourate hydrolase, partial [Glaciimonas sp.]|nr:hydroxyisourate hydrolase [Glaciimonas sp.]